MTRPGSLKRHFSGALVCALASLTAPAADAAPRLFLDYSPVASPPAVPALRPYSGGPALLYLALDGATITKVSSGGSAPADTSPLCGATITAFDHAPLGSSRAAVIADLVKEVRTLFMAYDLEVVTSRPVAPQYQMAVVGGAPVVCGFPAGYSGMAPLDCGDANPSDVLFVFSDGITSLKMLAIVIAHEAGHALGLPHSTAPCDVMSNKLCDDPAGPLAKTFLDTSAAVTPDHKGKCGLSTTNSHRQLLSLLGPRAASGDAGPDAGLDAGTEAGAGDDPGPAPQQGCAVGLSAERGSGLRWPGGLLLLVTLLILLNKRSPGALPGAAASTRSAGMGILDELTSATGDKNSNKELVKACLKTPALLHSVAEGLRTGNPKAKVDCALILNDVAKRRSELLSYFVADFLDASKSKSKRIAKLGFTGLVDVVSANPAEVYAERDYLLEAAKGGTSIALPAAAVIAALCGDNANYRGKLLGSLIRLLHGVSDDDLPKWVSGISPAVMGSTDCYKKLTLALRSRLEGLPEAARKKLDKTLLKIEKSTYKKK